MSDQQNPQVQDARPADREASELPAWRISRDAAGKWLSCLMELPEGGTVVIKAPTLDAIRIMDVLTENWVDAARRAAEIEKVR